MAGDADKTPTQHGARRRRATKRETAMRDLRFVEKLAAGVTIEEIAASEGISPKWARERKAALLARRAIDRPDEFIQLQIRRLSEAMLVAYSAMTAGNLKAVDQVIKVVRELDRYHGFGAYPIRGSSRWRSRPRRRLLPCRRWPCRSRRRRSLRRKPSRRPMGRKAS